MWQIHYFVVQGIPVIHAYFGEYILEASSSACIMTKLNGIHQKQKSVIPTSHQQPAFRNLLAGVSHLKSIGAI